MVGEAGTTPISIAGDTIDVRDGIKTDFDPVPTEREAAAFSLHRGLPLP
jgi:hypothetical protein